MRTLRVIVAAVAAAGLSLPLTACSDSSADDVMAGLRYLADSLQRQRDRDYMSDPFNQQYERDRNFWDRWPSDVPRPREGTPERVNSPNSNDPDMGARWGSGSREETERYGSDLENAGFERTGQTQTTDSATGRETTETTYRNENGTEVDVIFRTGGGGNDFTVVTRPGN